MSSYNPPLNPQNLQPSISGFSIQPQPQLQYKHLSSDQLRWLQENGLGGPHLSRFSPTHVQNPVPKSSWTIWNDPNSDIKPAPQSGFEMTVAMIDSISLLYRENLTRDGTLLIQGYSFKIHKFVVCLHSEFLKNAFFGDTRVDCVVVDDIEVDIMQDIIFWCYQLSGMCSFSPGWSGKRDVEILIKTFGACQKLEMKHAKSEVLDCLMMKSEILTDHLRVWIWSHDFKDDDAILKAEKFNMRQFYKNLAVAMGKSGNIVSLREELNRLYKLMSLEFIEHFMKVSETYLNANLLSKNAKKFLLICMRKSLIYSSCSKLGFMDD